MGCEGRSHCHEGLSWRAGVWGQHNTLRLVSLRRQSLHTLSHLPLTHHLELFEGGQFIQERPVLLCSGSVVFCCVLFC